MVSQPANKSLLMSFRLLQSETHVDFRELELSKHDVYLFAEYDHCC